MSESGTLSWVPHTVHEQGADSRDGFGCALRFCGKDLLGPEVPVYSLPYRADFDWFCRDCAQYMLKRWHEKGRALDWTIEAMEETQHVCEGCRRVIYGPKPARLYRGGRVFCEPRCKNKWRAAQQKEARAAQRQGVFRCEVCGKVFTATRSDVKTCSARCRQRKRRAR